MKSKVTARLANFKLDLFSIIAFVLGLSFLQGVVYITKVGNLYVDIAYLVGALAFIIRAISDPKGTVDKLEHYFFRGLSPFLILIAVSGFLALLSCLNHPGVQVNPYLNGLVVLAASLCIYFAVIAYSEYSKFIAWGLWVGLLINIVVSFMQYAAFQSGTAFTFYNVFPQPAFYISVPWGAASPWAENVKYLVYTFRAQGLYLEVSYFVGAATIVYLAATSLIDINGTLKTVVFVALLFLFGLSSTGNLVLFIGFIFLAYLIRMGAHDRTKGFCMRKRSGVEWLTVLLLLMCATAILIVSFSDINGFLNSINFDVLSKGWTEGMASSDLSASDNRIRLEYMLNALSEFSRYPWGGGYNMAPALTFADYGTHATFSYVLTLLVELGPLGLITYVYFIGGLMVGLHANNERRQADRVRLTISVLALFAFQVANGLGLSPLAWCIFGLASIEQKRSLCDITGEDTGHFDSSASDA